MSEDRRDTDVEIIAAAYAERVREAFRAFADNLGMGQNEKTSAERFQRSLELIRKARDVALQVVQGAPAEPAGARPESAREGESGEDGLSPEVREMIEHAVEQTRGSRKVI